MICDKKTFDFRPRNRIFDCSSMSLKASIKCYGLLLFPCRNLHIFCDTFFLPTLAHNKIKNCPLFHLLTLFRYQFSHASSSFSQVAGTIHFSAQPSLKFMLCVINFSNVTVALKAQGKSIINGLSRSN